MIGSPDYRSDAPHQVASDWAETLRVVLRPELTREEGW